MITNILELLGFFRSILRAGFLAVFYRSAIQGASDDVVAYARKVFDPAAAHQYDAVFLEVMSFTGNVSDDFLAIG